MKTLIIPSPVPTICNGGACRCPIITQHKACEIALLVNAFVTPDQPVRLELSDENYTELVRYFALASLRILPADPHDWTAEQRKSYFKNLTKKKRGR